MRNAIYAYLLASPEGHDLFGQETTVSPMAVSSILVDFKPSFQLVVLTEHVPAVLGLFNLGLSCKTGYNGTFSLLQGKVKNSKTIQASTDQNVHWPALYPSDIFTSP